MQFIFIFVSVRFKRYVFHILESILRHAARQRKLFFFVFLCYTNTYVMYCIVVWCGVILCDVVCCNVKHSITLRVSRMYA
jgi:hypothetical protein